MSVTDNKSAVQRYVDMWAFQKVHPTNVDLIQRLKMADDRQFGSNMDVCGTVSEKDARSGDWQKVWAVGIRDDLWKPSPDEVQRSLNSLQKKRQKALRQTVKRSGRLNADQTEELQTIMADDDVMQMTTADIEQRRLVLKLFRTTGKRLNWQGTIEERSTAEVHNSIGSKCPLLSFATILDGHDLVTNVEQNHRTFRIPSIFTFCFIDRKSNRAWHIAIKRRWISVGADFVIEAEGRRIGTIDGALIALGYNATIEVVDADLAGNRDFLDLVTLFTASVGYHRAMRRSLKRRLQAVQNGNSDRHVIEDEEIRLLRNPRRRAA